jgi:hypothetical protein
MDVSGSRPPFHPGVASPYKRKQKQKQKSNHKPYDGPVYITWEAFSASPLLPNHIRSLVEPATITTAFSLNQWLWKDRTLTQWHEDMNDYEKGIAASPLCRAVYPADHMDRVRALFHTIQRHRFLARVAIQRWRHRVWMKRVACNVDLIENEPVSDRDAILLTDTKNRTIFRFHRRDLFGTFMANITAADEYLPTPRAPTNPWTNQPLTMSQAMAICQRLLADFAKRGLCPPPLFCAFWAARFNIKRFYTANSAALSQAAIHTYFHDITPANTETLAQTIADLLLEAGTGSGATLQTIRRWLSTPSTPQHTAWRLMCRDYTLHRLLHVQARPHWYSDEHIIADVQRLAEATPDLNIATRRIQLLRAGSAPPALLIQMDPLAEADSLLAALQLMQQSLMRF